jgi:hypothetical protein
MSDERGHQPAIFLVEEEDRVRHKSLLGSLIGSCVAVVHMTGAALTGGRVVGSGGIFCRVWTLIFLFDS